MADQLISTATHDQLPESYVRPESQRPRLDEVVSDAQIPVVDLAVDPDPTAVVARIGEACAVATGFVALLIAVSGAFAFGGSSFALLLSFMGVIASVNIIFAGVSMADDGPVPLPPPIAGRGPAMLVAGVGGLAVFLRRNIAFTINTGLRGA
ncbi:unnamed protein product [Urochloa humidicola]